MSCDFVCNIGSKFIHQGNITQSNKPKTMMHLLSM